jgi:hypothetical protein
MSGALESIFDLKHLRRKTILFLKRIFKRESLSFVPIVILNINAKSLFEFK